MAIGDVAGYLPPQSLQRWAGSSGTWEGGHVYLRTVSDCTGSCASAREIHTRGFSLNSKTLMYNYALGKTILRKQVEFKVLTSRDSHSKTWSEPQPWEAVGTGTLIKVQQCEVRVTGPVRVMGEPLRIPNRNHHPLLWSPQQDRGTQADKVISGALDKDAELPRGQRSLSRGRTVLFVAASIAH